MPKQSHRTHIIFEIKFFLFDLGSSRWFTNITCNGWIDPQYPVDSQINQAIRELVPELREYPKQSGPNSDDDFTSLKDSAPWVQTGSQIPRQQS